MGLRQIINGLLWLDRSGARWRDRPARYGPWQTLATRFYRWRQPGIWHRILDALQAHAATADDLDWEVHCVDGTLVRAQHAARATGGPRI